MYIDFSQIFYIGLGWILGLLSPLIVDYFGSKRERQDFLNAVAIELQDLQMRLAFSSFKLEKDYGQLTPEFLNWLAPIVDGYEGGELVEGVDQLLHDIRKMNQEQLDALFKSDSIERGIAAGMKVHTPSLLLSNLQKLSRLPQVKQFQYHELINALNHANQDIEQSKEKLRMTFDGSISETNHELLVADLHRSYRDVAKKYRQCADKITSILQQ